MSKINTVNNVVKQEAAGHPKGLWYIVFTEAWERFSFYGMQGLLILYLSTYLLQDNNVDGVVGFEGFRSMVEWVFGSLSNQALATQIFGIYVGLVYFLPVFGGVIGDRYIGRTKAVIVGAVLMALGHFMMASEALFLIALGLLVLGSGFLKGNLAAQVGQLYEARDPRRESAYSLYTVSVNVGAFTAPLVCGTLGELVGWHYGFGAAGVGMIVGMIIYMTGLKYMPKDRSGDAVGKEEPVVAEPHRLRIALALCVVILFITFFWVAQTQIWNVYPLWVKARVDRVVADWTIPVTWFQSFDTLTVLLLAPLIMWYWRKTATQSTNPKDIARIAFGCMVFAVSCCILAMAETKETSTQVNILWPLAFHALCAVGYLHVSPVTLSLVSKRAPLSINAMMIGGFYLAIFAGSTISGWLGRFYGEISNSEFWFMHAMIVFAGGVLLFVTRGVVSRALGQASDEASQ